MKVMYVQISCPICAEWIEQGEVVELLPGVVITNTELSEFLALLNMYASHIVQAHTTGLDDKGLSQLYMILDSNGLVEDFDTWKKLFTVVPE
jgi:hypothetical protein